MDPIIPKAARPKSRQSIAHIPSSSAPTKNKENATADISSLSKLDGEALGTSKKRLRSKSLGPGGLEVLQETDGNTVKQPSSFQIKSILKPTIPLTPPKVIPSFDETRRRRSTGKDSANSPSKNGGDELLIDFSTPGPSQSNGSASVTVSGSENVLDPFSPMANLQSQKGKSVAVSTEEQQDILARDHEAEERRQSEKKAILDQLAARRKSMANRRVSFAPEATLHTWNVIELVEDSTTSSASNSTRRQSSMTSAQSPPRNIQSRRTDSELIEAPSTPEETGEATLVQASPAHQGDLQKKMRRRNSVVPPMDFNNPDNEDLSSSPCSASSAIDAESSPERIEDSIHSDDETDPDVDTAMSLDEGTAQTLASHSSTSSTQSSLDERLREAANQAGTRGIDYDENGDDMPMEIATGTITNAFQPWAQNAAQPLNQYLSSISDQENINPFSPAFKAQLRADQSAVPEPQDGTQDMSMDVTAAVGGILTEKASPSKHRRKSVAPSRRRSSVARRHSSGEKPVQVDGTMEFTTVQGGIIQEQQELEKTMHTEDVTSMSDEEMTMELTNVIGGVLNGHVDPHCDSMDSAPMDETMDMTAAVGGILPPKEENTEPQTNIEENATVGMDITAAVGEILPPNLTATDKVRAKQLMEEESDGAHLGNSPRNEQLEPVSPPRNLSSVPTHIATSVASETGSPSFAMKPRLSGRGKTGLRQSTTPQATPSRLSTPVKSPLPRKQATPTKQLTPLPNRAETPNKTPIIPNVAQRGASPKKLFKAEIKAKASPASAQKSATKQKTTLFDCNEETGQQTPSVVLRAPKPYQHLRRRSSGLGIDREGLGSPRVTALLDRRESIGDVATVFVPDGRRDPTLRFDDPKAVEEEMDAEREEDERRESGRFAMEQEADRPEMQEEESMTVQLKEMIESMTPKKNKPSKLKGRKSLHVGAARGILGKRPAELDLDDDEEVETTPKRLKAVEREASPVKRIHLPKPPSKDETTGRVTRVTRQSLGEGTGNITVTPTLSQSPGKSSALNTPQPKGRFKETPVEVNNRPTSFEDKLDNVMDAIDVSTAQSQNGAAQEDDQEEEKIPLQAFLNMTNIHFIELSTTKRRNTVAHTAPSCPSTDAESVELEHCFAAAATTLPLLELYQHATRELKSYISTGRRIIRSIEAETLEEQPPLFREYIDARPDIKMVMDNQFRNGKANARLQSKEGWYAWRGQLVDGLRGGLEGIKQGMEEDAERLGNQERILDEVFPGLTNRRAELEETAQVLQQRKYEMDSIDHGALKETRLLLSEVDQNVAQKEALLKDLQSQMQDKERALVAAEELRSELESQIMEAERVREECRGWSAMDVGTLKEKVDFIEKETGWTLVTAEDEEEEEEQSECGVALMLQYKDTLRLFLHPQAFRQIAGEDTGRRRTRSSKSDSRPSAPISLTYAPKDEEISSLSLENSTERRFFLQFLRSQLHAFAAMPRGSISSKSVLTTVASGWETALRVDEEVRLLNMAGITSVSILGDEKLGVTTMLLLPGKGRVDVEFVLTVSVTAAGIINNSTSVSVKSMYGTIVPILANGPRSSKVQQALGKEIESKSLGQGAWLGAVKGFEQWSANAATATEPKRSPLKEKRTPMVQKKAIPVPQQHPTEGKRAEIAAASLPSKLPVLQLQPQPQPQPQEEVKAMVQLTQIEDAEYAKPRTPTRRTGGLRRSPLY